jgi:hypothetical protein
MCKARLSPQPQQNEEHVLEDQFHCEEIDFKEISIAWPHLRRFSDF